MALAVLRLIGEELRKDRTARVIAQVPVSVATYLINEKREWLRTLEDKSEAELIVVPNENIQTPEYTIRRVRDDEMELPEQRQATYLMPTAPEVTEPGTQERKPPPEPAAVAPLLPATSAPVAVPSATPPAAMPAPPHGGFWSRFKKILAGEPAPPATPEPAPEATVTSPARRRDEGQRRDGRRDHGRHSRYADGARRDRDGRREGRDRDRGRDHSDRDRNRERGRRPEPSGERGGERPAERAGDRSGTERQGVDRQNGDRNVPETPRQDTAGEVANSGPPQEGRSERTEGRGRGRRGRRRGRRGGGGGAREGAAPQGTTEMTAAGPDAGPASSGNGHHDSPAAQAEREAHERAAPQSRPESAQSAAHESHAEPRESGGSHESVPIAHFEPSPRPESGTTSNKPYVVWSSTPEKDSGPRGPDE
jgi:ribonuclease E